MQLNVFIERLFLNKSKHFKFFFKKIELFETLNDILYIKFMKHNFLQHRSKYNNSNPQCLQVIPHNACPIFMKM